MALERMESPSDLGKQMRELRLFVGLSQMELAVLCRCDISTISRWERGIGSRSHRKTERSVKLALEALNCAAELQRQAPDKAFALDEFQDYVETRKRERSLSAEYRRGLRSRQRKGGKPTP